MGYHRAGFDVVGIDIKPQKHYPFPFILGDALLILEELIAGVTIKASDSKRYWIGDFAAIHASPPCQGYSHTHLWAKGEKPLLIGDVRKLLEQTGKVYVIENVSGAAKNMQSSLMLCGLSFDLKVFRHRYFESNILLLNPHHISHEGKHIGEDGMCSVVGSGDANWHNGHHVPAEYRRLSSFQKAMDIDWMTKPEITQAIPPAYTEFIGKQLMNVLAASTSR